MKLLEVFHKKEAFYFKTEDKTVVLTTIVKDRENLIILGYHRNNIGTVIPTAWNIDGEPQYNTAVKLIPYSYLSDLKRVYKEGARIEMSKKGTKHTYYNIYNPKWDCNPDFYRIRGGITIEQWDKHKEAIKAYWDGKKIEIKHPNCAENVWNPTNSPKFSLDFDYRERPSEICRFLTRNELLEAIKISNIPVPEDKYIKGDKYFITHSVETGKFHVSTHSKVHYPSLLYFDNLTHANIVKLTLQKMRRNEQNGVKKPLS